MTDGDKLKMLDEEHRVLLEKLNDLYVDTNDKSVMIRDTINACQQLISVCEKMKYLEYLIYRNAMNMRI